MDDFIQWDTLNYDCPVHHDTVVEVIDNGGFRKKAKACMFYWFFQGWATDVAWYRLA